MHNLKFKITCFHLFFAKFFEDKFTYPNKCAAGSTGELSSLEKFALWRNYQLNFLEKLEIA